LPKFWGFQNEFHLPLALTVYEIQLVAGVTSDFSLFVLLGQISCHFLVTRGYNAPDICFEKFTLVKIYKFAINLPLNLKNIRNPYNYKNLMGFIEFKNNQILLFYN
jgi:hypothetical protein